MDLMFNIATLFLGCVGTKLVKKDLNTDAEVAVFFRRKKVIWYRKAKLTTITE